MPVLKPTELLLKENGFTSEYILSKERQLMDNDEDRNLLSTIKQPLGQNVDIVIPKKETTEYSKPCKQFIDIFGTPYIPNEPTCSSISNNPTVQLDHHYKHNDQERLDVIAEFIKTETNYVSKLEAMVKFIVLPLKDSCENDKYPILDKFYYNNIFFNVEQIYELHDQFVKDLHHLDFSTTCENYMKKMILYRTYLLKMEQIHTHHETEYQKNQAYRSFLIKATKNPKFENFLIRDLLDAPWKRITAYSILIPRIRNHTSKDHPDFDKLTNAFTEINTIASARDDTPTILATKSREFHLMIKNSPCDIIKQNSTFVTHWDALELNRDTGKLHRYVTLFLFRDKIMVIRRSQNTKGAELCDYFTSGPIHPLPKKRKDHFKFQGRVPLEHIEITHGPSVLNTN
ncbi:Dbl homology domain-containing protein [Cunninghamella echinulata]|nr:Dbl homology domain-containing protein [Cunninghamella echinulata]